MQLALCAVTPLARSSSLWIAWPGKEAACSSFSLTRSLGGRQDPQQGFNEALDKPLVALVQRLRVEELV
jgi:hypothetical protein